MFVQKAWEAASSPVKNLLMMAFMLWMSGSTLHIFSLGIVFSALFQPITALRSVGKSENAIPVFLGREGDVGVKIDMKIYASLVFNKECRECKKKRNYETEMWNSIYLSIFGIR